MSQFFNNSIFWVEVDKIKPNPFQPRKEFDEAKLNDLAKSIRQYGVLQPLVVSRTEVEKPDGGMMAEYELIAGERRLRASKLAGVREVPVLIRQGYDDDKTKLELAIIENLQREDLNPIDRAKAFDQLIKQFGFKHQEVADKVGKSREYVSNTVRLLTLPEEFQQGLAEGKITEGHCRPLLMLASRPEEQMTLYREILLKKVTVRDAEAIARRIATDRVRKKEYLYSPDILQMEKELGEALRTRVNILKNDHGNRIAIDFTSEDDLRTILSQLVAKAEARQLAAAVAPAAGVVSVAAEDSAGDVPPPAPEEAVPQLDDRSREEKERDENTFDPSNFSL